MLKKPEFSPQIFGKSSKIKSHENPSTGRQAVPFGLTLTVAFRNVANAPKKVQVTLSSPYKRIRDHEGP
jgi:hypothetical protein